jgi:hypothetical protein
MAKLELDCRARSNWRLLAQKHNQKRVENSKLEVRKSANVIS